MKRRRKKNDMFVYEPLDYEQFKNVLWELYEFISDMKYNLYTFDIDEEKQFEKYIQQIETIIRKSQEYKIWTNIHQDIQCQVTGYTKEEYRKEIELHHHPYTLYEITSKVQTDLKNKFSLDYNHIPTFIVQNEVITLHLLDIVPFVPLLRSYHRMYHQTPWEIPKEKIINNELLPVWDLYFEDKITLDRFIPQCLKIKHNILSEKGVKEHDLE